jgi:hypothetical protein
MATTRVLQRSFAGGEVTPEFHGRIDDQKYQTGLSTCKNFVVFPHGPIGNRGGTKYVNHVKNSAIEHNVRLIPFTFSTTQTMVLEFGHQYVRFHTNGGTLLDGSSIYEIASPYGHANLADLHYVQSADVMTITHPSFAPQELRRSGATSWAFTTPNFGEPIAAPSTRTATASGHSSAKYDYTYVITSVAADDISESSASASVTANGNLLEQGGIVTVGWGAVTDASRYNVYKLQGGIFGFIGQSESTSIIDDNIAPDMGATPPNYDAVLNSTNNFPAAVSYYEQRRVFAGTNNEPSNILMTKSGTESDMSFRIPVVDDDRISFRVAAREANTIRHVVPLTEMILLTSAAEWRVTSLNSDAITPSTISVKPQSYVGASNVQPIIVNNSLIYAAARGGHVRELGYNWQANGFITGDLSVRAPHLFDEHTITDIAFSKAPYPIAWFVRNDGVLLGFTYMPEQGVGAWHQHTTENGTFESVCVVAEGDDDVLYAVVKRTIDGAMTRYIERMQPRYFDAPEDAFFVDCGLTLDGTNAASTTMTISGGTNFTTAESLTLTASSGTFLNPVSTDKGDAIVITDTDGVKYTLEIVSTSSTTIAQVRTDKTIPVSLRSSARTAWAFARDSVTGLTHLEGQTVNILADGAVHPQRTVSSGAVSLDSPSVVVQVGLPITADIETLPITIQMEAFGQGRYKNINQVALRVFKSSGIFVGPNVDNLTEFKQRTTEPYGSPPALKTQELRMPISPSWNDSGQIFVRQKDPLPITIVAVTSEVTVGG